MEKVTKISQSEKTNYDSELLLARRTTRVTKGGRRYSFQALVGVGDRNGQIGLARSRGADISIALERATIKAKKSMKKIPIIDGTIPFEITTKYKSAKILLLPSKSGGIIAGGAIRKLCALAGIKNIRTKIISRTKNKINHVQALFKAFKILDEIYKAKQKIIKK